MHILRARHTDQEVIIRIAKVRRFTITTTDGTTFYMPLHRFLFDRELRAAVQTAMVGGLYAATFATDIMSLSATGMGDGELVILTSLTPAP